MKTLKFGITPVSNDFKIPFDLTEQALTNWLHELPAEHYHESGRQLLGILQVLHGIGLTQQLLIFLPKISAKLDIIVEQFEKNYLDAGFPLESDEQTKAEFVTVIYATLAENYVSLGRKLLERRNLDTRKEIVSALFLSLQALGNALLNMAKTYMKPYEGFWLNCYAIYKLAEDAGLLDFEIALGEKKGDTVNAAFKHILLFELSDTKQFRPREMKVIYSTLKNFLSQIEIETGNIQKSSRYICAFNLSQDRRPHELSEPLRHMDTDDRYISPLLVAKNLHLFLQQESSLHNTLKSINHSFFKRAIKSLGRTQKRKFNRKKEQLKITGIVGFNHVASYLFNMNNVRKEQLIQKPVKDPRFAENWKAPDFDLVPIGVEPMPQMKTRFKNKKSDYANINKILQVSRQLTSGDQVWNPTEIEKNKLIEIIPTGDLEIIDSSAQGFQGLWKSLGIKVKVGDIIALPMDKNNRVEVGLIRSIARPTREDVCLGIEIIGFESEAIHMFRPERKDLVYSAILLPGIPALKQADCIVYNTSDFSTGEFVIIHRGKETVSCRLNKLINSTPAITHMELYRPLETL